MFRSTRTKRLVRLTAVLAAASAAALGLAGCSGSGAGSAGSATSGNITWWGWTPQPNNAKTYIADFNKKYPNIHVTYKQVTIDGWNAALRPALASSNGPDVFNISPGQYMTAFAGSAIDLKPAVEKALGSDWKSKLAPTNVTGLSTSSGKLAAVSAGSTSAGSLWINADLFKKYDLQPPKTLADWKNVCSVFKSHGVGCFVQGVGQVAFDQDTLQSIADSVQPGMWTKATQGKVKWTDPVFVKTLDIWKSMFKDGIFEDGALGVQQYPDASNDFMSQKYAMVMMGTWYMQYATQDGMSAAISAAGVGTPVKFPILPISFPDVAGKGNPATLFGDSDYGLAVNAKSKQQAAATTFAVWLGTSKAGQQAIADGLNDIPSLKGVNANWDAIKLVDPTTQKSALTTLTQQATASSEPRLSTVSANLQTAIGVAATTVAAGKATPAQAVQTLQTASTSAGSN
ncbi:extracellular solute-binding protein [Frondihabitans australicus]|uniref:ABC-type glycerol-3-phosphate transport system substrate-binding protein n=1 Tax=Frondihabitans australicus TaxID=386892 RepID=A0A495ILX3_9MICO|nr:extracellular solute-binding protein [Frondihabitans australicus]RKR76428.1 ABC-type glycerol-3-phosphate transport system substrate-binding protein [Frondihabitans australicus]